MTREEDETIEDRFIEEVKKSDQLEFAVGFVSYKSLRELDKLVTQQNIKNVSLILGMYFFNGFPKELLKLTLEINDK
ncbi:NgoFVII family restriction endonuclease [Microbacterium esteraromaticum]|nr:NgoFVII family restriction endonuclease [Microbacterium esteraromaticum]